MQKLALASLALAALVSWADFAKAGGCGDGCAGPGSDGCGTSCAYVDQVVCGYRPEWHERQVQVTVNRLSQREVVEHQTVTTCVPVWTEEKRTATVYKQIARQVVNNVTEYVPVTTTEKRTRTVYKQVARDVVSNVTVLDNATMAVVSVFTKTKIGNNQQIRRPIFDGGNG